MSSPIKVAVVGYGMSAQIFHIPFINNSPHLALHTIIQRSPPAASSLPDASKPFFRSAPLDYPSASITHLTTLAPALADPAIGVVVVTTPPGTHGAIAREAIDAGKHVLVEKPFCPTAQEARALAARAREKGVVLCSFNNRRWDADFLTLRALVEGNVLGRVVELNTHFDRFRPSATAAAARGGWKASHGPADAHGPIYDLGSHLIDQAYVLFGMPASVYGRMTVAREGKVDVDRADTALAVLNYTSGLTVLVRAGVVSAEIEQPRFWVRGTKGSWRKEGVDPQEAQLIAGKRPGDEGFGVDELPGRLTLAGEGEVLRVVSADEDEVARSAEAKTYAAFYEEFARAVKGEGKVPVAADEAADVLQVIEAVLESARTGREVPVKV